MIGLIALLPAAAMATVLSSPSYRLDPNVANTFGGTIGSASYQLTDSGGETVIGSGTSTNYKLTQGYVSQLSQSIQLSILPSGTVAYYPLDTGTGGQAFDVSTNENQGVLTAGPTWTTGKLGQALSLNGTSQYINVPHAASLDLTGAMSIEAWINVSDYANTNTIAAKTSGNGVSNNSFELRTEASTGKLQFLGYDSAARTVTSAASVSTGAYVHVAVTKAAGMVKLYINGLEQGSGAVGTTTSNTNAVKLGVRDDLANFFKGSLDEIKIYNRALSAAEVASNYEAGNAGLRHAFTLANITPGISQTYSLDAIVRTDAGGYDLFVQQNHDLRHSDGSTTIPAIAATIAAPAAWSEGTTKGLGFSLTAGTQLDSKWGTGPSYNYAAVPSVMSGYHARLGYTGGGPEHTTIQFRADTSASQKQGKYSNTIIYTATLKP